MMRIPFKRLLLKQHFSRFSRNSVSVVNQRLHNTEATTDIKNQSNILSSTTSQVNDEVKHHENFASDWWNSKGSLYPLHSMNMIRVPFIRDGLIATNKVNKDLIGTNRVLENVNILEVGCGGGILTENLARIHANVTGIDLSDKLITIAREHLKIKSPELLNYVNYKLEPIEQHRVGNRNKYDAVVVSEVIEHIDDKAQFISYCVDTLKPGGSIFITTPNRTIPSLIGGIFIAENILNLVPKGTHDWNKFISPIEMQRILDSCNCSVILVNGIFYEFWQNTWKWVPSTTFCYGMQAIKSE